MLLYSTLLRFNDSFTPDSFLALVAEWNQNSPHAENIVSGFAWNGEHTYKFGTEDLWIESVEYKEKKIIAVRYEQKEEDGTVWDTDFTADFSQKKIAVQLDRSYTEGASMENLKFSTPYFVKMLIDEKYIEDDSGISMDIKPVYIRSSNISLLADVINGKKEYQYPVIYVSKTELGDLPVDVGKLCYDLKGVAHVFQEDSRLLDDKIRSACHSNNEYNGGIGIYFPRHGKHRRFLYHGKMNYDFRQMENVRKAVLEYANIQKYDSLFTWYGVNAFLMKTYRSNTEKEITDVYKNMEQLLQENEKLTEKNSGLGRAIESLKAENRGLHEKLQKMERIPLLYSGDETDLFEGEIHDLVMDILAEELRRRTTKDSRREHVLKDILENNEYRHILEKKREKVQKIFSSYTKMNAALRQEIKDLGFDIMEDGKHYKLVYYGDERYKTTISKTGSDHRGGRNMGSKITNSMM